MTDLTYIADLALAKCGNCEHIYTVQDLDPLTADVLNRVQAGEPFPAGGCPDCGAYAHIAGTDAIGYRPGKLLADLFSARPGGELNDCQSCKRGVSRHAIISMGSETWRFVCLAVLGVDDGS